MPQISTDNKLIEKFLTRGVEKIYPSENALRKKLLSGERLKIYQGFDPTGPYLHVGHAIGIRALRLLQELGHEVIFLVGDFTAKIGDPDKDSTREILTDDKIEKNLAGWREQASQLIDFSGKNAVKFLRNSEWLAPLSLKEIIVLMSKITAQRMLHRSLFKKRIEADQDLMLHELLYPLLQGYDSVAMKIDIEIAGADQTFNTLIGRDLVKNYLGKEKFVRTNIMMDAPSGTTMSKTKGNGINLADSAEEIYGKAMSYPDSLIISGLELLTDLELSEIKEIKNSIKAGENPMEAKKLMAWEIVKMLKGEIAAQSAQDNFIKTVQKKETPDEIKSLKLKNKNLKLIDLLVEAKLAESKSEARRLIKQNGIKLDGQTATDPNQEIILTKSGILLQRGKRQFVKIQKL